MKKFLAKSAIFSILLSALSFCVGQISLAAARCSANGVEIPCDELGHRVGGFISWGIGIILLLLAIGIWAFVFWIMMIVHAATKPIEDRGMWVILMVFAGIIGALIYYFVVKRKFDKQSSPSPMMKK